MKLVGLLLALLVAVLAVPAVASDLDVCGTLTMGIPGTYCSELFLHVESAGYFLLDDYAGFSAGDVVHVIGSYPAFCWMSCPDPDGCLTVETIELCATGTATVHSWGTIKALYR